MFVNPRVSIYIFKLINMNVQTMKFFFIKLHILNFCFTFVKT